MTKIGNISLFKMAAPMWNRLPCKILELRLDRTLACGQSFRWKEHTPGVWSGVLLGAVFQLKQTDTELFYKVFPGPQHKPKVEGVKLETLETLEIDEAKPEVKNKKSKAKKTSKVNDVKEPKTEIKQEPYHTFRHVENVTNEAPQPGEYYIGRLSKIVDSDVLTEYFQLGVNLENLYKTWSEADSNFDKISKNFAGIRMLRQDPVECVFSFICSSNNHISRITSMVDKLGEHYGEKIQTVDGVEYFTFPTVSALAQDGVEEKLRSLGFGYRAKYIHKSAQYIEQNGGEEWLYSLRNMQYAEAKANLMKLCGVGAKVADCVLLMSLDKPGAIPVDTHVWQIAARDYMPKLKQAKSLTPTLYDEIGDCFRKLWGDFAGWAHSVLFTADLKQFKEKAESPKKKLVGKRQTNTDVDTDMTSPAKKGKNRNSKR